MKLVKYFVGSLIISFGVLMLLAIVLKAVEFSLPEVIASNLLWIWIGLALVISPFAKNFIRVE